MPRDRGDARRCPLRKQEDLLHHGIIRHQRILHAQDECKFPVGRCCILETDDLWLHGQHAGMAGALPHEIDIRMRQFDDKEEDANKDKEEIATEKEDRGIPEGKYAQPEAVQLSQAHECRDDPGL